ncbi:glycosyltransferase [Pedobacter sp. Leaf132]|uniref:glycosyltransferase n=1 Tax=Pedobacter sp. Leaf132 TaxID=2876557 RepID=UPI001E3480E3|nr:glycosyltransferase [Pedobacter sp. Leaf132]
MKILFAIQYFYPTSNGGTERYVYDLAKELIANGNEVAILKIGIEDDYYYEDLKVYVLPKGNFSRNLTERENSILAMFKNILEEFKPDLFHLNTLHEKLNAHFFKLAKKMGIPCAFTSHLANTTCSTGELLLMGRQQCDGEFNLQRCFKCALKTNNSPLSRISELIIAADKHTDFFSKNSSALMALHQTNYQINLLKEHANLIFVQSEWQKNVLLLNNFNKSRLHLIRLGLEYNSTESHKSDESKDSVSFGFIARFSKNKGLKVLINALEKIKIRLNLFVCISIDKKDISIFEKSISTIKLNHQINIIFNANKSEVLKTLDCIDALIVPSLVVETGPYVVLESLSRNTPVIGSNIGGIAETIIHRVNGLLFEMGNDDELTKSILDFIENPIRINCNDFPFEINSIKKYASEVEKKYKNELEFR